MGCSNCRSWNEAALQVQEDLYNQARAQMKAERKAERKYNFEEFKADVKAKFDKLKALTSKVSPNVTETPFKIYVRHHK